MRYHIVSIFPEIFSSFFATSLLAKAIEKWLIHVEYINPRDFCTDPHRQIDDKVYGWWVGLLMKAQPIIDAIKSIMHHVTPSTCALVLPEPSPTYFTQRVAQDRSKTYDDIIFVCGRYEWIDHRVELRWEQVFWQDFYKLSLGQFVTLGGEVPTMMMIEATTRLLPEVIHDEQSRQDESYRPECGEPLLEYPQYTRPEYVEWMRVPDVLLSGHHQHIEERKQQHKYT